jgi:hypothetical protein
MALIPPRSRDAQVYENWLHATPTDETYLAAAYDYLDSVQADYVAWKVRKKYADPGY